MSETVSARRPLWQRIGIALSLGLNVLVIGAVAGFLLVGERGGPRPPPFRAGTVAPLIGALPAEDRREVFDDLRRAGSGEGITRTLVAEDRAALTRLIAAEPFDPAALVAQLDSGFERFSGFALASHRILAEHLSAMSPEERADYAARLERFERFRGDHGDDGEGSGDRRGEGHGGARGHDDRHSRPPEAGGTPRP